MEVTNRTHNFSQWGRGGLWGCEILRIPHCVDNCLIDGGKMSFVIANKRSKEVSTKLRNLLDLTLTSVQKGTRRLHGSQPLSDCLGPSFCCHSYSKAASFPGWLRQEVKAPQWPAAPLMRLALTEGRAITQAPCPVLLTGEVQIQSQNSPCGICGWWSGIGTVGLSAPVFLFQLSLSLFSIYSCQQWLYSRPV
jgi:hypothetical protein